MTSVTVVAVAYNSAEIIGRALASVITCAEVSKTIVVDNASVDGTSAMIRERFPSVELIPSPKNIGYGRGCNLGLANVRTPYALLLNPDAVMHEGSITALIKTLETNKEAAIAAPLLVYDNGEVYTSYKRDVFTRERYGGGLDLVPEGEICAGFLSGAVWLIRMDAWQKIGGFDHEIFLFYEDDDACMRLREQGFSLVLNPKAKATHSMGRSSLPSPASEAFKQEHLMWSRAYIERKYRNKNAAKFLATRMVCLNGAKWLATLVMQKRNKRMRYAARMRGALNFFR